MTFILQPLIRCFVQIPYLPFGCCWRGFTFFSLVSSHEQTRRPPMQPRDHQLLGCPRTRTVGAGCCAAEIWTVGWVLLGATPIQAGTCRWRCSGRCADAAVWQGSEEPGQLLLIKSQLWFLSGEPLSKGIRREASADLLISFDDPNTPPGPPLHTPTTRTGRRLELLAAQLPQLLEEQAISAWADLQRDPSQSLGCEMRQHTRGGRGR